MFNIFSRMAVQAGSAHRSTILTLMTGLLIGFCVAQLISYMTISESIKYFSYQVKPEYNPISYEHKNTSVADQLKKEVRVLCWVMTSPANHKKRARHVKRTWGKRCNILLFMSSEADDELPTVKLNVGEGRPNLWRKVKEAFKYVYEHHFNDADWFYKADDDTYAVIENLRYMLYPYNPETPVHFGYKFKPFVKQGYMSGGPGYVLSKEALRRMVVEGIPNPKMCLPGTDDNEDVEMGQCMENLNVTAGDSRDWNGRGRMFPLGPELHLIPQMKKNHWYWTYMYYQTDDGLDCCSDNAISFHHIKPGKMYVMDYLIYHLKPYGIVRESSRLPAKLGVGEYLPAPVEETANSNEDSIDDDDRIIRSTTARTNGTETETEPDSREVDSSEVELNVEKTTPNIMKLYKKEFELMSKLLTNMEKKNKNEEDDFLY